MSFKNTFEIIMTDTIFGSGADQWVCPNDRQLALRAKLKTGWSVHTNQTDKQRKNQCLNPNEMSSIVDVIRRAEKVDVLEQQRIGRLVERLENMRKNVMGNGMSQCLLCGEHLGILGTTSVFCQDCKKKVCTKCGIETVGSQKRPTWLCKICSEQREVWKRSGAWFYKGIPKYILPLKIANKTSELHLRNIQMEPQIPELRTTTAIRTYSWAKGRVASSDSESDSELSCSSVDDKSSTLESKEEKNRKNRIDSGSSTEPTLMPGGRRPFGGIMSSGLSGSLTSLGSDRGGTASAPESYPGELLEGYDSDIIRRAPDEKIANYLKRRNAARHIMGKHRGNANLRR
ncbi:rab effector Noc2 isoform X2 [Hyperolius riggenbachi]|uniref:rab effector Noc2 isoform X2 n=1 Tax=Hyperolius riggenbachi TaxID=752182 RepID=UPI0035A2D48F